MSRVITSDCQSCGACAESCPCDAISEGADKYVIDASKCVDCGVCQDQCPFGAIAEQE